MRYMLSFFSTQGIFSFSLSLGKELSHFGLTFENIKYLKFFSFSIWEMKCRLQFTLRLKRRLSFECNDSPPEFEKISNPTLEFKT